MEKNMVKIDYGNLSIEKKTQATDFFEGLKTPYDILYVMDYLIVNEISVRSMHYMPDQLIMNLKESA